MVLLKTQLFGKNAIFPVKKTLAFFLYCRTCKCQGGFYKGPDCILTSIVQAM